VWNKRNDEGPAQRTPQPEPVHAPTATHPQPYAAPVAAPAAAPPRTQFMQASGQTAAIGTSMRIKGEIRAEEELVVDGEVEGSLESKSLITVGPNGKVKANIRAREVVIFGTVHGNIDALEKIAIRDRGSLVGDIKTAGISIDDGAYFKGSIDIVRPEPKIATKPTKHEPVVQSVAS
jgi:cytoskeletal protein CcmA (bactofilin family)